MCGIFGVVSKRKIKYKTLQRLTKFSSRRGKDSGGVAFFNGHNYDIKKVDYSSERLISELKGLKTKCLIGHSRLITNGLSDNQPISNDQVAIIHNGIILNHEKIWKTLSQKRELEIDTEILNALYSDYSDKNLSLDKIFSKIGKLCKGVVACAFLIPKIGKLCLFSNNGSLYLGEKEGDYIFASEKNTLSSIGCLSIQQIRNLEILDIPKSDFPFEIVEKKISRANFLKSLSKDKEENKMLIYPKHNLRRCTKCILPETMPFIAFDESGVCNYCKNYEPRLIPQGKEKILGLVEKYRSSKGSDCVVPFSGGRDSSYGLHLIIKELKLRPVTFTYDWGMVTDLARRNISLLCSEFGVENIVIADDLKRKRNNVRKNLIAWLKYPRLGMLSILTAGDKHFFKYVKDVKRELGIGLNLWGINPLEVTHFKAGFLGVPPAFEEKNVYNSGYLKQLRYQYLRFQEMLKSPKYFNNSLWDTFSGEYYRTFSPKKDYFHIFDFWKWDEQIIEDALDDYGWERAPDTESTWRIGDGTAAFYNYAYYLGAGFTEHDTFRSNQIREGQLKRKEALRLVEEENSPRYPNLKWYLDILDLDFKEAISCLNSMPSLYR